MLDSILSLKSGNTLIVGAFGAGKTMLINSLHPSSHIVLDSFESLHLAPNTIHGILGSGIAVITVLSLARLGPSISDLLDHVSNFVFFRVSNTEDAEIAASISKLAPTAFLNLPDLSAIVCDRTGNIESLIVEP